MSDPLQEMRDEWKKDAIVDSTKIARAVTNVPLLHSKYLDYLVMFRAKRASSLKKLNMMKNTKRRFYRGELALDELNKYGWSQWQGLKPSSSELNQLFEQDSDLNELEERLEYWNTAMIASEYIMKSIASRGYELKSLIDYERFINGG